MQYYFQWSQNPKEGKNPTPMKTFIIGLILFAINIFTTTTTAFVLLAPATDRHNLKMSTTDTTPPSYKIRPVTKEDLPGISKVADATELFPGEMVPELAHGYLEKTKEDLWFVAQDDSSNTVVSFGFCEPERMTEGTWNLLAIAVLPSAQGTGVGTAMMEYLEEELKQGGHRVVLVETSGLPAYDKTRAFYEKRGFVKEAMIRDFYCEGEDKIVYWKKL